LGASLEVADIFRAEGAGYRAVQAGHLSRTQLKVMSAIENCRTAALGGHIDGCDDCGHWRIAYNSCRNRHCPKCQGAAARLWLAEREADLLPIGYFHIVFTLPAEVADVAWQNKAILYAVGDSRNTMGFPLNTAFNLFLGRIYADKDVQERIIRESNLDLDWVIARPVGLTNGRETGAYKVLVNPKDWRSGFISRADVAEFLVKQIDHDTFLKKTPVLLG
jgi:hypothetical protein